MSTTIFKALVTKATQLKIIPEVLTVEFMKTTNVTYAMEQVMNKGTAICPTKPLIDNALCAKEKELELIKCKNMNPKIPVTELPNQVNDKLVEIVMDWKNHPKEYIALAVHILLRRNFDFGADMMGGEQRAFCQKHDIFTFGTFIRDTAKSAGLIQEKETVAVQKPEHNLQHELKSFIDLSMVIKSGKSIKNVVNYFFVGILIMLLVAIGMYMAGGSNAFTKIYVVISVLQGILFLVLLSTLHNAGDYLKRAVKKH